MDFQKERAIRDRIFNDGLNGRLGKNDPQHPEKDRYGGEDDKRKLLPHFGFRNESTRLMLRSSGLSKDFFMEAFLMVRIMGAFSIR